MQRTPLWPASWLPAVDKSRSSKSVEVQRVWEFYDERLHSRAWLVWSGAAEVHLPMLFGSVVVLSHLGPGFWVR